MVCTVPVANTSPGTTPAHGAAPTGQLAFTGSSLDILPVLVIAGLLILAGAWLLWKRRASRHLLRTTGARVDATLRKWSALAVIAIVLSAGGAIGSATSAKADAAACDFLSVGNVSVNPANGAHGNIRLMPGGSATIEATITNNSNFPVQLAADIDVTQAATPGSAFAWSITDSASGPLSPATPGISKTLSTIPAGGSTRVYYRADIPASVPNGAQGTTESFTLSVSAEQLTK